MAALGITWQSAPALTEVEQVVTEWLRELTGLDPAWKGAIQDTASTGTLVAMLAARERASELSEHAGGLQSVAQPLVVYSSAHAHSSVPKAVLLAGFGTDNLRFVGVDPTTVRRKMSVNGPGPPPTGHANNAQAQLLSPIVPAARSHALANRYSYRGCGPPLAATAPAPPAAAGAAGKLADCSSDMYEVASPFRICPSSPA